MRGLVQMVQWERLTDFYCICIDGTENGCDYGRLYHRCLNGPLQFQNLEQLIFQMNDICNQTGFPKALENFRCENSVQSSVENQNTEPCINGETLRAAQGTRATFWIVIVRRQFNSWQGEIFWKETKKESKFNSVTELLMLLKAAYEADEPIRADA